MRKAKSQKANTTVKYPFFPIINLVYLFGGKYIVKSSTYYEQHMVYDCIRPSGNRRISIDVKYSCRRRYEQELFNNIFSKGFFHIST